MAVCGLPVPNENHCQSIANMALKSTRSSRKNTRQNIT
ncbi:MAG: hypothetical protein IPJ13_02525 [Saprospiraceae bacterium]|nr:hypothetical protein [Saprospiraceae bacterium]